MKLTSAEPYARCSSHCDPVASQPCLPQVFSQVIHLALNIFYVIFNVCMLSENCCYIFSFSAFLSFITSCPQEVFDRCGPSRLVLLKTCWEIPIDFGHFLEGGSPILTTPCLSDSFIQLLCCQFRGDIS